MDSLPIASPVAELRPEDGRTRVTFKRLASIYYLTDDHPSHATIMAALRTSLESGDSVKLTYELPGKTITGIG